MVHIPWLGDSYYGAGAKSAVSNCLVIDAICILIYKMHHKLKDGF